MIAHRSKQRVPAAGEQAKEWGLQRLGLKEVGRNVSLQVPDRNQGQAARRGECLGATDPDEERSDQARSDGDGDGFKLLGRDPGLCQSSLHHRCGQLEVMAGSNLGNDAPKQLVGGGLGRDHVGEDPLPVKNSRTGVITGGLDREDQSSHMISASSPLSW